VITIKESYNVRVKTCVKDGIPEERKYGIIDRNYTPF